MSSWSKVVESFESMPEVFKSSYQMALGNVQPFPYTVFAPSFAGIRRKTTEKLLCEANDSIYIWEHVGSRVVMAEYPLKAISDFEVGEILLYSWITISGVTKAGMASSSTVEFNTATGRYFTRFANRMRPAPINVDEREQDMEKARFDYLATEGFKFMNYAQASLVRGERVLNILWQPKIRKPLISAGKHVFYQTTVLLAHLVILTDKEIIVIQDDERSSENRGARYGGKWQYIALRNISAVSLLGGADDLLSLLLTLSPGEKWIKILFAASQRQEIVEFQSKLEKLTRMKS